MTSFFFASVLAWFSWFMLIWAVMAGMFKEVNGYHLFFMVFLFIVAVVGSIIEVGLRNMDSNGRTGERRKK